jgi:diguanylate cyclase (GGDEF)-like protein/putative nucleotidyltransferase with HDIG domain
MIVLGLGTIIFCLLRLVFHCTEYRWLFLASLAALTSVFSVKIPGIQSRISVAETFVFTNLVLFGPAAGAVTAGLDALTGSFRFRAHERKLERTLFNMAAMAFSAFVAGRCFFVMLGKGPLFGSNSVSLWGIILPVCLLGLTYYVLNSGSVAAIVALERRRNIYHIWRESFLWTFPAYLSGASIAGLIAIHTQSFAAPALLLIVPVILVIYFTHKTYLDKVAEHVSHLQEVNTLYCLTVESLALAVDVKDQTTYGHVRRVRAYALGLARLCGITDTKLLMAIETGALLHDIGKLAVDDCILNKPAPLNSRELEKMKVHSAAGDEILRQIQFPFPVAELVRFHHERYDGTGYPDGLRGDNIPLGARILIIADTFDAIRSNRPYKREHSVQETIEIMQRESGKIYDPRLLRLFIDNIEELEAEATDASKNAPQLSLEKHSEKGDQPQSSPDLIVKHGELATGVIAELIRLQEFTYTLGRNLSLEDLLLNLECRIKRLLPFTTCLFYLDNGDRTLYVAHAAGKFAEMLRGYTVSIGKGINGWVAAYRQPMLNADPGLEFLEHGTDLDSLSDSLAMPLLSGNACIGTISLFAEAPQSYSVLHLRLLELIADLAAPLLAEAKQRQFQDPDQVLADAATGLPKAPYLAVVGPRAIAAAKASGYPISILCLDFSNLPELADLYGFDTCDRILNQAARQLRAHLRENDPIIRYGYQAFIILLSGTRKEQALNRAQLLLDHMKDLAHPDFAGLRNRLDCRAGVSTCPEDGTTVLELIQRAQQSAASPTIHLPGNVASNKVHVVAVK